MVSIILKSLNDIYPNRYTRNKSIRGYECKAEPYDGVIGGLCCCIKSLPTSAKFFLNDYKVHSHFPDCAISAASSVL